MAIDIRVFSKQDQEGATAERLNKTLQCTTHTLKERERRINKMKNPRCCCCCRTHQLLRTYTPGNRGLHHWPYNIQGRASSSSILLQTFHSHLLKSTFFGDQFQFCNLLPTCSWKGEGLIFWHLVRARQRPLHQLWFVFLLRQTDPSPTHPHTSPA